MALWPISGASLGLGSPPSENDQTPDELRSLELAQTDRYTDGGQIGRGGMGEIRSVHDGRLGRTIAIKTPVASDRATASQFVAEATLTARLVHPGIIAIHDAGITSEGRPYYTMPIVHGRSLAEAIAESPPGERLRLVRHFLDACEAIAYAHSQGVLHRDLKPSNILVGRFGETLVVDWGLAGPVGAGSSAGTPDYMPPEQARGEGLQPTADVFALGVTLRTILTGAAASPELSAIVERATQVDPAARYPDGRALAEDVAAWFEGRRVAAHRYSLAELMARIWAAHRVPLLVALLAIVGIVTVTVIGYRRTTLERSRALESERDALAARARAEANLAQAEVAQALVAMARDAWPQAELLAAGALMHGPSPAARGVLARFDTSMRPRLLARERMPMAMHDCVRMALSLDGSRIVCGSNEGLWLASMDAIETPTPTGLRGRPIALFDDDRLVVDIEGAGLMLVDPAQPDLQVSLQDHGSSPHSFHIGEQGRLGWVSGGGELWTDIDAGAGLRVDMTMWCSQLGHSMPGVVGVRSNGSRVLICQDGGVLVSDSSGLWVHELLRLDPSLGAPVLFGLSTNSRFAALSLAGGSIVVVDLDEGRVVRTITGPVGTPQALALTESRLAISDGRESVSVWEIDTGVLLVRLSASARALRWLDEGRHLRLIGEVREDWELPGLPARPHVVRAGSGIAALSISPTGRDLLTAHGDGRVRLTRLDGGAAEPVEIPLHWSVVKDVEFSPDGHQALAVCAQDDHLHVIDLEALPSSPRTLPSSPGTRVAWLADDRRLLAPYSGRLAVWPATADPLARLADLASGRVQDMESDADRRGLTLLDSNGILRWTLAGGAVRIAERPDATAVAGRADWVAFATARTLETITLDGRSHAVDFDGPLVTELALSPDGRMLALGHLDGSASVWSSATLERLALLHGHVSRVSAIAFDARGEWLVTGSWDGDVRQWSMRALELSPEVLVGEAEAAWGITLDGLLAAQAGGL